MCVIAKENVPATTDRGIWHVCNVNRAWLKQASTAVWSRHQSPTVLTVFLGRGICILLDTLASNFKTSCHFFNLNFQLEEVIWKMNDGHWRAKHKQQILTPMRNMNFVLFRCPSKHILIMGKSSPPPNKFSLPRHVRKEGLI